MARPAPSRPFSRTQEYAMLKFKASKIGAAAVYLAQATMSVALQG